MVRKHDKPENWRQKNRRIRQDSTEKIDNFFSGHELHSLGYRTRSLPLNYGPICTRDEGITSKSSKTVNKQTKKSGIIHDTFSWNLFAFFHLVFSMKIVLHIGHSDASGKRVQWWISRCNSVLSVLIVSHLFLRRLSFVSLTSVLIFDTRMKEMTWT